MKHCPVKDFIVAFIWLAIFGVLVAYGGTQDPKLPDWSTRSFDGGRMHFCAKGAIDEFYYGQGDEQKFYLRIFQFHGKVIAIVRHEQESRTIHDAWLWTQSGGEPNEYFSTGETLKNRIPGGPCDVIPFHITK